MAKILLYTFIALFASSVAMAQSLVPATSEDLSEFDSQISQAKKTSAGSQFGAKVSEQARALQNQAEQKKKKQGASVGSREDSDKSQAGGSSASSAKDAKVSSPKNSDHGNSANAPGHNKKK